MKDSTIKQSPTESRIPVPTSKVHLYDSVRMLVTDDNANRPTTASDSEDQHTLSLLVITWNMMGTLPKQAVLDSLISPSRSTNELIVVGTQ
jgi:hypothetical protein